MFNAAQVATGLARLSAISLALSLSACGGGGESQTVVNEQHTLVEGATRSYAIKAGTYTAHITSSNNGVEVSWVGGTNCNDSSETKSYSGSCVLPATGQLVIVNPTVFGLGGAEIITVQLVKE